MTVSVVQFLSPYWWYYRNLSSCFGNYGDFAFIFTYVLHPVKSYVGFRLIFNGSIARSKKQNLIQYKRKIHHNICLFAFYKFIGPSSFIENFSPFAGSRCFQSSFLLSVWKDVFSISCSVWLFTCDSADVTLLGEGKREMNSAVRFVWGSRWDFQFGSKRQPFLHVVFVSNFVRFTLFQLFVCKLTQFILDQKI